MNLLREKLKVDCNEGACYQKLMLSTEQILIREGFDEIIDYLEEIVMDSVHKFFFIEGLQEGLDVDLRDWW